MQDRNNFWTNEPLPLRKRAWDSAWPWLVAIPLVAALVVGYAQVANADDTYVCADSSGCIAIQSTDSGTRTVVFKKGDLCSTGKGWIMDTRDGWVSVDLGPDEFAGLLP